MSRNGDGEPQDGFRGAGLYPSLSGDGALLAFYSDAGNLSTEDDATGSNQDVFVKNLATGAVTYVSRASGASGEAGNSGSGLSEISGDGRRVAFGSVATNLAGPATNIVSTQIYVRDLTTSETILVSRDAAGDRGDDDAGGDPVGISADGNRIVFGSSATNLPGGGGDGRGFDTFVHDLATGTTEVAARASDGTPAGTSIFSAIGGDGEHVAFTTPDGLVADDTDGESDLYLHRFVPGGGGPGPSPTATATAAPTATATASPTPAPPPAVQTIRGDPAFVQGTANDLYLACTKLDLYLVDVLPAGRRVSVTAPPTCASSASPSTSCSTAARSAARSSARAARSPRRSARRRGPSGLGRATRRRSARPSRRSCASCAGWSPPRSPAREPTSCCAAS